MKTQVNMAGELYESEDIRNLIRHEPQKEEKKPKYHSKFSMKKTKVNMAGELYESEDIRNLIRHEPPKAEKFPIYHSKFSNKVREDAKKHISCHKTFGYAEVPLDPPSKFLKKRTRIVRRPLVDKQKFVREPKPSLPPRGGHKDQREKEQKNYRKENIVRVVRAVPKHPVPQVIDTRGGHTQPLEASGLQPQYIYKKGFGQIPKYLRDKYSKSSDKEEIEKIEKDKDKKPPLRYVTEDERDEMLEGLKKNWEELQKEFQLLPMVTDTVPKIKRKTQLESQLRELEKDIDLIERNPVIYVYRDQDG